MDHFFLAKDLRVLKQARSAGRCGAEWWLWCEPRWCGGCSFGNGSAYDRAAGGSSSSGFPFGPTLRLYISI